MKKFFTLFEYQNMFSESQKLISMCTSSRIIRFKYLLYFIIFAMVTRALHVL